MYNPLTIEKSINRLESKIIELESFSNNNNMDFDDEIIMFKNKLETLKEELYENLSPWQKVNIARLQSRPTCNDYIDLLFDDFIEFHGDRYFGDDKSIIGGIGLLENIPVTIIGHQKGKNLNDNIKRNFGMANPEGYRKALRLMKQAEKFNRPIITFIDTPGAYCGLGAEERGQGEAIARNLMEMSSLKTPIIIIIIGEGGSGGALGLGVGDSICMLENSIYSVISPEGLASILWKDSGLAKKASEVMKLTSQDLLAMKVIDKIIEEPLGGAHKNIDFVAHKIKKYLIKEINDLKKLNTSDLLNLRYNKFRQIGI